MIRVISIASLVALLILVLYLPSAHPPEHFIGRLRIEHGQTAAFWTHQHAQRILVRTLDAQARAGDISPVPDLCQAPATGAIGSAVGSEMSAVNARLFNSRYFRSIDALLLLASYRFFTLLEWLPWLVPLCLATLIDGGAARSIKSKLFLAHDPEVFAVFISAAIMLACGTVIALVLPFTLPPILLPAAPVCLTIFAAAALRNFHRRG